MLPHMRVLATVGHSTRSIDEFVALLQGAAVDALADVRRFPSSKRCPWFGQAPLSASLAQAGIAYRWFPELGGRRSAKEPSPENAAWRVKAFHAYADHLATSEGRAALDELAQWAELRLTAIMCAEALWTKCHRRLIADAFVARGWNVRDIVGPTRIEEHRLPDFALLEAGRLTYPAAQQRDFLRDRS